MDAGPYFLPWGLSAFPGAGVLIKALSFLQAAFGSWSSVLPFLGLGGLTKVLFFRGRYLAAGPVGVVSGFTGI